MVQANLRVSDAVEIVNGKVVKTTVLANKEGSVFLEFLNDTRVFAPVEGSFAGSVLPPVVIDRPYSPPLPLMQDVVVFSFESSMDDMPLQFADKMQFVRNKTAYRLEHFSPEEFERTAHVRVFVPLDKEVTKASLWQFIDTNETRSGRMPFWVRMGGRITQTDKDPVFVAHIKETGTYAVFNENPNPTGTDPVNPDDIELAELPPYIDEFTDPQMGLNEAGLFDSSDLELYEQLGDVPPYIESQGSLAPTNQTPLNIEGNPDAMVPGMQAPNIFQASAPLLPTQTVPAQNAMGTQSQDMIPSVTSLSDTLPSQSPARSAPPLPIYASYVQCDAPPPRLDTLPGAPNWQRPNYLNPDVNTQPLTQDQINQIPTYCRIFIPRDVMQSYQDSLLALDQNQEVPQNILETQQNNGSFAIDTFQSENEERIEDEGNTIPNDMNLSDLQAQVFHSPLPKTGNQGRLDIPFGVLSVLGLLGASVWVIVRQRNQRIVLVPRNQNRP